MTRWIAVLTLALACAIPIAVWAQDKAKGPLDYSLKQYGLVLGFALLGGFVAWYGKVRKGILPAWSINHLVGELVSSAFAGLLCFWMCEWANFPQLLTAAFTGVAGHMGTRAIGMFETLMARKYGVVAGPADQALPVPPPEEKPRDPA